MSLYMKYSTRIYNTYLKYISADDIYVYSIDEIFCDLTSYLNTYRLTAKELVTRMIRDVYETTGITATAGIGTNLFLAKVAMDIVAKHTEPNSYGVRIAELENKIEEMFHFSQIDVNQEIIVTNERHRNAIIKAKTEMKKVLKENQERIPMDMLSIELQNAIQHLGEITGESVNEEVINGIFKKFCLGK